MGIGSHPYVKLGIVPPEDMLYQFLDTNGDGSGTDDAGGVDGSVSGGVLFYIEAPSNYHYIISRLIITLEDAGNFVAGGFGAEAALSEGQHYSVHNPSGTEVLDLTDGKNITANANFSSFMYDVSYLSFGTGNNFLSARWSMFRAGPKGLWLPPGYRLHNRINDNLSGIVSYQTHVQGFRIPA
jgi:hypothetical protein